MKNVSELIRVFQSSKLIGSSSSINLSDEIKNCYQTDPGYVYRFKMFEICYTRNNYFNRTDVINISYKILCDPIQHNLVSNLNNYNLPDFSICILVGKHHGVTDDEAMTVENILYDFIGIDNQNIKFNVEIKELYLFEKTIPLKSLEIISTSLLSNPLIQYSCFSNTLDKVLNKKQNKINHTREVKWIELTKTVSEKRHLGFSDLEIQAVLSEYNKKEFQEIRNLKNIPNKPSDCELELIAQTWSEHCKHKEFNAEITYIDLETGANKKIISLFNTYIKKATNVIERLLKEKNHNWLVKVFADNAGIVRINSESYFIWKVETHNSPSFLDPYGGAITGILGNNRDALGTGMGGAKLLFNTNVLCFGPPNYNKALLKGQKHPQIILKGVVRGIEDGGNKSGIPTVNGSIHFDERYSGKPLVFCGTGAVMSTIIDGCPTEKKPIAPGDCIVMAGGRVGKDGIHGATLSSCEMHTDTPGTMVQIGSPFTQKKLSDFLEIACAQGLVKTCTDNGAGGLGSSVGEMAQITNGAFIELDKVPLKYEDLAPWEIFISESQERMTLVIDPENINSLFKLSEKYQVEVSCLGHFTKTGFLEILYNGKYVAFLSLNFLHNKVPQKQMSALWKKPKIHNSNTPKLEGLHQYNKMFLELLSSYNICSKESIIRQYDHEVKGNTIVKPLMGPKGAAPQDAAVVRLNNNSYEALIISNGILPRIGDVDPYQMSAGSLDEAIRQIISVGGTLPDLSKNSSPFWSLNDNFCLPNCCFDEQTNPDGQYKLAQLVKMCEALYDYSTYFLVPMTSGKDSMKNDFISEKKKISIPPTILYSCVSQVNDYRTVTTSYFKNSGDVIYLLGDTYDEMACSEFYYLLNISSDRVPIVRKKAARDLYRFVSHARDLGLLSSCHDLSDGGLAIALAESAFGGDLGAKIRLPEDPKLSPQVWLFSESPSRFIVTIRPENQQAFENLSSVKPRHLGYVTDNEFIKIYKHNCLLVNLTINECIKAWQKYDL